ncbi:MAG: ferric reductase-like transmembrane domain-containing protein [Steroidobacteraceae bacterium]
MLRSRYLLWILLALPAAFILGGYWRETLVYGEVVHSSGETAARLLIITMAATPLCLMFPGARLPRWLLMNRRYLGVASFAYALLHALTYLERKADLATIVDEGLEVGMATGWVAMVLMLLLAVTSNDASVRLLRKAWKSLHRWVYAAALLTYLHWVLSAFDPTGASIHFAVLALLEGYRIWKVRWAAAGGNV